jgi:phenylacetate-CoA ligase
MDIQELIAHLSENAPAFVARLDKAGLPPGSIRKVGDLNRLPVMRKDDLIELQSQEPPFGGFLTCEPGQLKRVFQSPGPLYDPESRVADYWRWAPALRAAGFQPDDVALNAFGYHLTPAGAMFEEGLWAVGCAVIPAGVGNQEQQVSAMHTLRASGYVGLPSYLKALLDKAAELDLELYLEKAFVTAEPLPESLRTYINRRGVVVRQGYGTAECGNLASGEPLPPGESGEIVVTLFNRDYALVRFGTGDLSSLNPEPCACGRESPRLMGWQGRVGEAVKVRGMFLHPRQLAGLMQRFPEVARWQGVVTRREHKDYLALRVVPRPEVEIESLPERLVRAARDSIKFSLEVEIVGESVLPDQAPPIQDTRTWE